MTAIDTEGSQTVDRLALLNWLAPNCEPGRIALLYPKGKHGLSPGWVIGRDNVERALDAYRAGTLAEQSFTSTTKQGKPYRITGAQRLGLVPHRNGRVLIFCVDLDDHDDATGGTVQLAQAIARFFATTPLTFSSKGGKGLHCYIRLATAMDAQAFVEWARLWGFNRQQQPEIFPKTTKHSQAWLPNEPNEQGGDRYIGGSFTSCIVQSLPPAPSVSLTTRTLDFLRGFVQPSNRNIALNSAAYELGQKAVSRDEAWTLCQHGARLCGLAQDEPEQTPVTFESGYEAGSKVPIKGLSDVEPQRRACTSDADRPVHDPQDPVLKFRRLDGIGNGERFIDNYGQDVRYCYELDHWLVWTGRRWSLHNQARVEGMAKRTARLILQEMEKAVNEARDAGQDDDELEKIQAAYRKHYQSAARVHGVRDTLKMAQSEPGVKVTVGQLDANPMLLNVANGTVELTSGRLRAHQRGDGMTKVSEVRFDPQATCPRWQTFLNQIFAGDQELIHFIQRAVGYSLTGQVDEQCLFFLFGNGQNGKSVFIQTLLHVLGEYAQKAPTEMIMKQDRSSPGGATPDMARLRGVRLAVTAEMEENQRMGEARVKDLTGSDRIVARPLYCQPVEFDPTHKLWIYGNHKPTIRGTDEGIWRRIRLIPFAVTIANDQKDPQLLAKLQAERDGILAWAVAGCLAWQRGGLGSAGAVTKATEAYRHESDRLAAFLEECCIVDPNAHVGKSEVYAAYERWCHDSGEYVASKKKLSQMLTERGFTESRSNRERHWQGVGLLDSVHPDASK